MENKTELIEKVGDAAYEFERTYTGCSQCVVGAFKKILGNKISDEVFKASTGFSGGIGLMGGTCGAFIGGVIVLSNFLGREYKYFNDPQEIRRKNYHLVIELSDRFKQKYNSYICKNIQERIMGRSFNFWNPDEYKKFLDAGGDTDKCPSVCKSSACWVMEILIKNDLIKNI